MIVSPAADRTALTACAVPSITTITGIDFSLGDVAPDIRPCYAHANYPGWPAGPQSGG